MENAFPENSFTVIIIPAFQMVTVINEALYGISCIKLT